MENLKNTEENLGYPVEVKTETTAEAVPEEVVDAPVIRLPPTKAELIASYTAQLVNQGFEQADAEATAAALYKSQYETDPPANEQPVAAPAGPAAPVRVGVRQINKVVE